PTQASEARQTGRARQMSRRQDANTLEAQNDAQLDELHSKLRSLHAVTIDIHNDSRGQNAMLDTTSSSFDSLGTSLTNSASRLGKHITNKQTQGRTMMYAVGAVFVLFLVYRYVLP
ncbi:MAG: hypothetical protein CYPHOPRED_004332, partial [Cyphobasidiales sp. Tagirdzhanova-0007]